MSSEVATEERPSVWTGWVALVLFAWRRQAQLRLMVAIAVGVLLVSVVMVGLINHFFGWKLTTRFYDRQGDYGSAMLRLQTPATVARALGPMAPTAALLDAANASAVGGLEASELSVFTVRIVFVLMLGFLMPLWTLAFATNALGSERENRTLVWLLTRPQPRWAIYLAEYVGLLPWCLGFNLAGFGSLCLAAGPTGRLAWSLYWPAIVGGTFAFAALYHFIAVAFPRPTLVALLYSFFLESIVGCLPGTLKRASINFYTHCVMFDSASRYGIQPERPSVYAPVSGPTAWAVLLTVTFGLLLLGMVWFSRAEYRDEV